MTPLETALTGITAGLVTGIVFFIIKDVFWSKAQKNQDTIDTNIINSVKVHTDQITELEKITEKLSTASLNQKEDITELRTLFNESNKGVQQLVKVLETVNKNMDAQHNDIRTQNAEIKQIMDKSNQIMQSTSDINRELLGYLKGIK